MLIRDKKHFTIGLIMLIVFAIVLIVMSLPIFGGKNAFESADNLYNSIAKGSSYKIPQLEKQAKGFKETVIDCAIDLEGIPNMDLARKMAAMAGIQFSQSEGKFKLKGDLGRIAMAALKDSDLMYYDKETQVSNKYAHPGKEVLFVWWKLLNGTKDALKRKTLVSQASFLDEVVKKGIEVGYNFYGIAPEKASSKVGTLVFSLVFYVLYTIWWGFSIFFLFEGFGLTMEAGKKEEM
ncbi:MAG: hypothetical protein WAL98_20915 [Desulfatiglandaceae bacterium]|jgi:hypothetical protein